MNVDGRTVSLADFDDAPALLVMFMCNHCPFVKHLADRAGAVHGRVHGQGRGGRRHQLERRGQLPGRLAGADGRARRKQRGYQFPYLYDETQEVAKAYRAACTPDFFLFDRDRKLVYRGQFDDSRPDSGIPVTGADLRAALDAVLAGKKAERPAAAQHRLQHQMETRQRAGLFRLTYSRPTWVGSAYHVDEE